MEQIDILMATYNGETYLTEQLDSILAQTYSQFRLLISDDASTDRTKEILQEYEKKDARIQVFYQETNVGSNQNFAFLLQKVENEWYMLSDQDDIWLPDKIEKTLQNRDQHHSDLVFTDLTVVGENKQILASSFWKQKGFTKKIKKDQKREGLRLNNYITGCTILTTKKLLPYVLPLPTTKHVIHDYWIAIVASLKGTISYVEEPTILYRQHQKNQVGYERKSDKLDTIEEIRNLFLEVKIELFELYQQHRDLFTQEQQKQNEIYLAYYRQLKQVKKVQLKNGRIFHQLYRYETISYRISNFIILHMPVVAKIVYSIIKS